MAKVTIEDISRHTGLSRGTVSRALNNRPDISEATKQRVLEACRKLNYVPSHAARSLATGRNYAVAAIVDDLSSVFTVAYLRGVIGRAQEAQYFVNVFEMGAQTKDRLRNISPERIDGVLIGARLTEDDAEMLRQALGNRVLAATSDVFGLDGDVLTPDQRESGRLVGRQAFRAGADGIVYLHDADAADAEERLAGFREVCEEHGADADALTVGLNAERLRPANVRDSVADRVRNARVVVATDDFLATDAMLLCTSVGRVVGRDVAVFGQGNERFSAQICPTLSSVDFGGEEIGRRSMDTVLSRIAQTRTDPAQTIFVAPQLIARDSSAGLGG